MKKPPILFLEQQSWRGGAQKVLDVVLDSLQPDFQPVVVFPEAGPYSEALRRRSIETRICPLGAYQSGRKSFSEMLSFVVRSVYCALRLSSLIRRRRIQLVYINGPRWLVAGVLAARLTGCSSIFHLHLTLSRRADLFLASRAGKYVTRIVTCSRAAAASLVGTSFGLKRKTQVLYNPLSEIVDETPASDSRRIQVGASSGLVIGIVGRITEAKGHHILLRAVAKLRESQKAKITLLIVGEPMPGSKEDLRYDQSLKSSATELGLEGRILWAGYQADLDRYYSAMDLLAFPSTCEEGMGLVLLEAMSRGIPVIASRVGGVPEVVEDRVNGLLVPSEDANALAGALERILIDPALRKRMGSAARASIDDRFSIKPFRRKIRSLISELCSTHGPLETTQGWKEVAGWK